MVVDDAPATVDLGALHDYGVLDFDVHDCDVVADACIGSDVCVGADGVVVAARESYELFVDGFSWSYV